MPTSNKSKLAKKIQDKTAILGVVGLGYVGLPLAVEKSKKGYTVLGYDINADRVQQLIEGRSYIPDVSPRDLERADSFVASTNFNNLAACDVITICVPTPLTAEKTPDISHIRQVVKKLLRFPGKLIILESTTYPGTTREVLSRYQGWVAYSPERVNPGSKHPTWDIPRVVGGLTPDATDLAVTLYKHFTKRVVVVDSPEVAEMSKLFENTFRFVNIQLVNEMLVLCRHLKINPWQMLQAAYTKPYSMIEHWPGLVGGHCIGVDHYYLTHCGLSPLVELAQRGHEDFESYIAFKINNMGHTKRVTIVGTTYKPDVPDVRESPAERLGENLVSLGMDVNYHDPLIDPPQVLTGIVILMTPHSHVDYQKYFAQCDVIWDLRNYLKWDDPRVKVL